ncbi:MAG: hypothetical protein FWG04_02685 [Desulfovibrionaceae bacterium]|nr:hypothetical protein [Desulfovibrionaceae bacterium]
MFTAEQEKKIAEKRRLAILSFLEDEPDLRMGSHLLQLALEAYLIKGVNSDEITADTDFLRKAGLLTLEHIGSMPALRLTQAGRETAKGTRKVAGVQKPPLD